LIFAVLCQSLCARRACARALLKARLCSEQEKTKSVADHAPCNGFAPCAARTRAGGEGHEDCDGMEGPCRRCGCPQDDLVVLQDVSICTTATRTHTHHTHTHTHTHTHRHAHRHTHTISCARNRSSTPFARLTHQQAALHTCCLAHSLPSTLAALHTCWLTHSLPCTLAALHARCLTHSLPCTFAALHARCLAHSPCCRYDLTDNGVTIVEDLGKKRQPMLDVEAVYLCTPNADVRWSPLDQSTNWTFVCVCVCVCVV
jgi:hypothetical protein